MKEVSFDEYMANYKTYKNGDIIPMKEEDIRRVVKATESGKLHNKLNKIVNISSKHRNVSDNRYVEYKKNINRIELAHSEAVKFEKARRMLLTIILIYIAYQVS